MIIDDVVTLISHRHGCVCRGRILPAEQWSIRLAVKVNGVLGADNPILLLAVSCPVEVWVCTRWHKQPSLTAALQPAG